MKTEELDGWPSGAVDYRTYYQCMDCGSWTLFEHYNKRDKRCSQCNSKRINPQSATSLRSFDADRAKKKEAIVKKEQEKLKKRMI